MICFDITKKTSFSEAEQWFDKIKKSNGHPVPGK